MFLIPSFPLKPHLRQNFSKSWFWILNAIWPLNSLFNHMKQIILAFTYVCTWRKFLLLAGYLLSSSDFCLHLVRYECFFINFILCNFSVRTLQYLIFFCPPKHKKLMRREVNKVNKGCWYLEQTLRIAFAMFAKKSLNCAVQFLTHSQAHQIPPTCIGLLSSLNWHYCSSFL